MSLLSLTPERLGAEGLAALEKRQGPLVCCIQGVRLKPTDRAVLRFVGALGGSCPRAWLNRISFDVGKYLQSLTEQGCVAPRVGRTERHTVALTELGQRVLAALPLPGETPPAPHPLREVAQRRKELRGGLPAGAAANVVEVLQGRRGGR